jgi:hypothetical protein
MLQKKKKLTPIEWQRNTKELHTIINTANHNVHDDNTFLKVNNKITNGPIRNDNNTEEMVKLYIYP